MISASSSQPYVLGIDLGSHSLGWALLGLDGEVVPSKIVSTGVRVFEAGKDATRDQIMEGLDKQKSRAAARREKRLPRRQYWRRARRRYNVLKCLITHGLLRSPGQLDLRNPADQDRFLKAIDAELHSQLCSNITADRRHHWEQVWLYELRASALDRKLEPFELGRVFYHLAQRRGFLSNRKTEKTQDGEETTPKRKRVKKVGVDQSSVESTDSETSDSPDLEKEDPKKVKAAIEKLDKDMKAVGAHTLGEFFARHVHPHEHRIRHRWTSREMYEAEFNAIWESQKIYHPTILIDEFRQAISNRESTTSIFYQRPLKPSGHLIGHCDLEPRRKRAPQAIPLAQRFRVLDKVNNLTVMDPDGRNWRRLAPDERVKLINALCTHGDMTFTQVRKLLNFKQRKINRKTGEVTPGHDFKLEAGPEEKLPGDRTFKKIVDADAQVPGIVNRWKAMSDGDRERLVLELVDFNRPKALPLYLHEHWGFSMEQAASLAKVEPEDKRCALSRQAMMRLLPFMDEQGMPFATAKEQIPEYQAVERRRTEIHKYLPRVMATDHKHLRNTPAFKGARDLRNPAVTRALAELRKVVNTIIRRHGRPEFVHIELGRELKKTPTKRALLTEDIKKRRKAREAAAQSLVDDHGFAESEVRETDKQKYLLYQEQTGFCPYCGRHMDPAGIRSGSLQIDHIIPYSVCLDNTMLNKTLCHAECNVHKGKRTPVQAWGGDPQKLHEIELAVAKLRSPGKRVRFGWTDADLQDYYGDDFTKRQLQDTQYASRLAAEYLGLLYGGVIDDSKMRRVQTLSGGVTAMLREEWKLNSIIPSLPDSPAYNQSRTEQVEEKLRTDHRHHAVDAIVIALTNQRTIGLLNRAASTVEKAELNRQEVRDSEGRVRKRFAEIDPPKGWRDRESFIAEVRAAISDIAVSHRAEHKLNGALHEGTDYSKPFRNDDETNEYRTRKPLTKLFGGRDKSEKAIQAKLDSIVDGHVGDLVRQRLAELKSRHEHVNKDKPVKFDPAKAWSNESDYPVIGKTPDDKPVLIKSVRIRVKAKPVAIHDRTGGTRYVKPGANHHMAIVAKGNRWEGHVVTRLDALRRKRNGEKVIQRDWEPSAKFCFTIRPGDQFTLHGDRPLSGLFVARALSDGKIEFVAAHDARKKDDIKSSGAWYTRSPNELRKLGMKKVIVMPLAELDKLPVAND